MGIQEILKNADGANITVAINLGDLRQWHDEVVSAKVSEIEQIRKEKESEGYRCPDDVCKLLDVSRSTLTRWKNSGYLIPVRVGGQCRYLKSDIDRIMNSKQSKL